MSNMLAKTWIKAALPVLFISGQAWAQEGPEMSRPYFFSGPCASQGMWTQQALNMTQRIREVTQKLRDDPKCKSPENTIQSMLRQISENLTTADGNSDGKSRSSRLTSLPQEISALRGFLTDKSGPQQKLMQTMMKKAVEYSTLSAEAISSGGAIPAGMSAQGANLLLNLGQRVQSATYQGLKTFNSMVDSVADNSECLTGSQQGQFLAAAASTLATFAMSGQDQIGNELAMGISKVSSLSRALKFSKVFKELNKIEFMNSMSCLMEITSESYCSARDGYNLYQEMNKQIQSQSADKISQLRMGRDPKSPMAGYYILTQQLPLVTNWLQKIQIGVEPRLGTDAMFKNLVLSKVTTYYKVTNDVLGIFNEKAGYIQTDLKDPVAKKNNIIELIGILTGSLDNSSQSGNNSEFFTQSVRPIDIPFRLIGFKNAPPEFFKDNSTISYDKWLQSDVNWATIPNSSNPDLLLESIGQNLRKIIENSNEMAITYYNRFFIFDKSSLYLDALLGTNYNIKDSLISIDQYLENLQVKINTLGGDPGYLVSIIDTQARIGEILKKFKKIEDLGKEMKNAPRVLPLKLVEDIKTVHTEFINEVYQQFDVLLGRSGWLSNRLSKFVYYDYSLTLRKGVDLSPYFKDLYYATGFAAYDRMINMASGGPANVESDLKAAMQTNNRNIQALELLFKDNLVAMIREQKLISDSTEKAKAECGSLKPENFKSLSKDKQYDISAKVAACVRKHEIIPSVVYRDMHTKSFMEGYDSLPGETKNIAVRAVKGASKAFWDLFFGPCITQGQCLGIRTDKYDLPGTLKSAFNINDEKIAFDDESSSAKYLLSRLCVQALAFNDLKPFWHLCKDSILESEFKVPSGSIPLKDVDTDYFRILFADKAYEQIENPSQNHSQRICAFRDFFRRNQVLYLTMGIQNNTNHTSGYTIEENKEAPGLSQSGASQVKAKSQSSETLDSEKAPASKKVIPTKSVKVAPKTES